MASLNPDERHLEFKVGAMILVALALLVAFILLLGGWSFKPQTTLNVYFQNPGGLSGGAAVKIAGRKVGMISEMSFLGHTGPRNPSTGLPCLVRARISIEKDAVSTLRQDAKFYVTTKGVLGDPFLEIDPGVSPVSLALNNSIFGLDPPRLDLFIADAYQLVKAINQLLDRNAQNLDQILGSGARLLGTAETWVDAGPDGNRIERISDGLTGLIEETRELVSSAKEKYIDDPKISRVLTNMVSITQKLDTEIAPMVTDIHTALASIDRLSNTLGPEDQKKLRSSIARLDDILRRTDQIVISIDGIITKVKRGEGTVGQLLQDQEIYDDLKELIRDIKRHPWKIIWEE